MAIIPSIRDCILLTTTDGLLSDAIANLRLSSIPHSMELLGQPPFDKMKIIEKLYEIQLEVSRAASALQQVLLDYENQQNEQGL